MLTPRDVAIREVFHNQTDLVAGTLMHEEASNIVDRALDAIDEAGYVIIPKPSLFEKSRRRR